MNAIFCMIQSQQRAESKLTAHQHHTNGENLFSVGIWSHIAEPHRCQRREREIQSGYITGL